MRRKKYTIISPDLDGLISLAIFKKYLNKEIEVAGTYNCESLILNRNIANCIDDVFCLDCNLAFTDSIDHHILLLKLLKENKNDTHYNLNLNVRRLNEEQCKKCPFNTEVTLSVLFPEFKKIVRSAVNNNNYRFIALLLYGDNLFNLLKMYRSNVSTWLESVGLEFLYDFINDHDKEIFIETKKLEQMFIGLGFKKTNPKFNVQVKNTLYKDASDIANITNKIMELLDEGEEFNDSLSINDFTIFHNLYRTEMTIKEALDLNKDLIASHAVKSQSGNISITLTNNNN